MGTAQYGLLALFGSLILCGRGVDANVPGKQNFTGRWEVETRYPGGLFVAGLQLTANGKVDKSALPAPVADQVELSRDYLPPHNQLERDIAAIWQECLRVNRVGRHQNFFDIGGNSLITIQVQSKLAQRLGKEVPVIDLFRFPTISALAEHLAEIAKRLTFQENQARAEMRIAATTNLLQMRQQLRGEGGRGAARPRSGN